MVANSASNGEVRPEDVQASFCDVLVDEWLRQGMAYAAIAPGSRSTPMALAVMRAADVTPTLRVDVFHDERSAAFAALGSGLASGRPALVLCTSGTAAAHLHAAVIEADLSAVPLIVCTADRPPESRDVGAPQTIDQTKLFGDAVRWFHDPGVPAADVAGTWRSLAARAYWTTTGDRPGPVHLNLPFREPLVGRPVAHLVDRASGEGTRQTRERRRGRLHMSVEDLDRVAADLGGRRGVIIAGRGCGDAKKVDALAAALGWPVFAEPRAGCGAGSRTVLHFDALLRLPDVLASFAPEIVLRLGEPPASKVLAQWAAAAREIHVDGTGRMHDPQHRIELRLEVDPDEFLDGLTSRVVAVALSEWGERWSRADRHVRSILGDMDDADAAWSGMSAARAIVQSLPRGAHLVLSSSMPIRDVEWFAGDCSHVTVHANRGANGIDGVIATAVGVARACAAPTFVLVGDVAAIHDASTLVTLASRDVDVRVVIVNNDGGGIFHHLPQATTVEDRTFEAIYGTPHGVNFAQLAASLGIANHVVESGEDLTSALRTPGPSVVEIRTDRHRDVEAHRAFHARMAQEIRVSD